MASSKTILFTVLIVMLAMADFTSSTAAASEARPHRRRRPTTATTEVDPDAVTSAPRLFSQRRSNAKLGAQQSAGAKALQWDIAESCKSEPGCEWSCPEDVYDCICRCKFDVTSTNTRYLSSRISYY